MCKIFTVLIKYLTSVYEIFLKIVVCRKAFDKYLASKIQLTRF